MNTPTPETDADDRPYPLPQYLQLIQFEGATVGVIAPEDYEALYEKARKLERERDEARDMISQTNQQLQWDLCICSKCGGEIFHHMDEPFYTCQKCGESGESGNIPKLQIVQAELNQLRKVCDELANQFSYLHRVEKWSFSTHLKNSNVLSSYNSLPHVIAAKKGNEV